MHQEPAKTVFADIDKRNKWVSYRNIRDFDISGDSLLFETRLRNSPKKGGLLCYDVVLDILAKDGSAKIHFNYPGCNSFIKAAFPGLELDGRYHDLSAFSRDLTDWHVIKLKLENHDVAVYFDDQMIYKPVSR